ncbi:MAG: hypothetical protein K2W96_04365 [Gemmataceae bacterium]|nr:hypothetical protein [Gemmataceae bacterium]
MTIRLERDRGETVIRVGLVADPDDLPHEHEARHKALVGKLLPPGGKVVREKPAIEPAVG